MKNSTIEDVLTTWFYTMLDKFADLSFRYEYNQSRSVYTVSYDASTDVLNNEEFCDCVTEFEDMMDCRFGINAPLLTEKDMWFKLSDNAIIVRRKKTITVENPQISMPQRTQKIPHSNKSDKLSYMNNDHMVEYGNEFSYGGYCDDIHRKYTISTPLTILAA